MGKIFFYTNILVAVVLSIIIGVFSSGNSQIVSASSRPEPSPTIYRVNSDKNEVQATVIPTYGTLGPCPSCDSPTESPVITGEEPLISGIPQPSEITLGPTADPCITPDANSASENTPWKHKKNNGGISNFMMRIMQFLLELINMFLEMIGGQPLEPDNDVLPDQPDLGITDTPNPCITLEPTTSEENSDPTPIPQEPGEPSVSQIPAPSGAVESMPVSLPTANGPCPAYQSGVVTFTPKGTATNKARIWVGPNPGNGALVFYFHGTGESTDLDVGANSLGQNVIDDILAKGGVVIAPIGHGGYEWYIADGDLRDDDLLFIDEMVACSIQQAKIDPRRIHATGLSSGATLTSDMVRRRSNYLASGAPQSGGFDPYNPIQPNASSSNKIAVMIIHGGPTDTWGDPAYEFYEKQSIDMYNTLKSEGSFPILCNHGQGHQNIPSSDRMSVWQFFQDHPYNVTPKPYASGLPAGFPSYCKL